MHLELSEHDFWPSRDVVYEHFQAHLHQTFPSKHWMRQKFRIQRPTHCNAQRRTYAFDVQEHAHFENNDWHYTKCLPSMPVTGDMRAIDRS